MIFFRTALILAILFLSFLSFAQEEIEQATGQIAPDADITSPATEPPAVNEGTEITVPTESTSEIPADSPEETAVAEEKTQAPSEVKEAEKPMPVAKPGVVSDEEIAPIKTKLKKAPKLSSDTYVQQNEKYKLPENYKSLDLNSAIEQGLRENHDEKIRSLKSDLIEIKQQSAKTSFWLPNVQLQLSTEEQRIGKLWKGKRSGEGASASAAGTFGLSLGDYTVFNWGKDYLQYLNKTRELKRNQENLGEDRRSLRHKIIATYFEMVAAKNIEKIMKNQLRQASFIFRLNKEKVAVGKASRQEYYESRAQYLKAQSDFQDSAVKVEVIEESLNNLLNDPHGISYIISQDILFQKISLPIDEALGIGKTKSATILDAKAKLEIADYNYKLATKESLPLPKISVNFGAYTNSFSKNGSSTTYQTRPNNSDIDLVATVNATWDILGPRGLLNSKEREAAFLEKEISLHTLTQSKDNTDSIIRELYKRVLHYEKQFILLEARSSNLQKNFDTLLDNYVSKRAYLNDLRKALDELTETQALFEQTRLEHLRNKILLAQAMGMENLPGESFEKLTVGAKGP